MKPFIHLFETPKNYYFYDVNKNQSIMIEPNLHTYLDTMIYDYENFIINEKYEEEIKELKDRGYLSDNRVEKIKHPSTDNLDLYLKRKLRMLTIQLTHGCNLRCSYCPYTSNDGTYRLHGNKKIDIETIKKGLLILRDNSVDSSRVSVGFYGGEPLVEFDLIKEAVNYCKEIFRGKEVNYTITTNGTLISNEILEFFDKEDFQIVMSLDGPKELNDKNRKFIDSNKSVFDIVIENIIYIEENYKRLSKKMTINMVIDPTQDFEKYKLLFEEYPILNNITIRSSLVEDDYKEEKYISTEKFSNDYSYAKFLLHLYYLGEIDINNKLYRSMFSRTINDLWEQPASQSTLGNINCPSGPCVPGNTRLMVNVDGLLFPCERVSENVESNCIGNVQDGFNLEKTEKIINIADSIIENCRNCFAFRHCTLCVQAHESRLRNDEKIKSKCRNVRYNFHKNLIGREIINEIIME